MHWFECFLQEEGERWINVEASCSENKIGVKFEVPGRAPRETGRLNLIKNSGDILNTLLVVVHAPYFAS